MESNMLSYASVRGEEVIPSTGEVDVRLAMLALLEGTYVRVYDFFYYTFYLCHVMSCLFSFLLFSLIINSIFLSGLIRFGSSECQCGEYITKAAGRLLSTAIIPNLVWRVRMILTTNIFIFIHS